MPTGSSSLAREWQRIARTSRSRLTSKSCEALLYRTVNVLSRSPTAHTKALLGDKSKCLAVWAAVEKHQTPWQAAIKLLQFQLEALSGEKEVKQRQFIDEQIDRFPDQVCRAVRMSWPAEDGERESMEARLQARLGGCTSIVEAGKAIRTLLESRPECRGVLPLPAPLLSRLYRLGVNGSSEEAKLALLLAANVTLSDSPTPSVSTKEKLASQFAMLLGCAGHWQEALSSLRSTPEVRRSRITQFDSFTQLLTLKTMLATEATSPQRVIHSIASTPHWEAALMVANEKASLRSSNPAFSSACQSAFLQRNDLPVAAAPELCFRIFAQLDPRDQGYSFLNSTLIRRLPREHPHFILLVMRALRISSQHHPMYSGTFTRRCYQMTRRGSWEEAIALMCAHDAYDMALPLVPHANKTCLLPPELFIFDQAVRRLTAKLPQNEGRGGGSLRSHAALALAHCLYGTLESLYSAIFPLGGTHKSHSLSLPGEQLATARAMCQCSPRLLALLNAQHNQGETNGGCHSFASQDATRLVMRYATTKEREYFARVIPPALLEFHGLSSLSPPVIKRKRRSRCSDGAGPVGPNTSSPVCSTRTLYGLLTQSALRRGAMSKEDTLLWRAAELYASGHIISGDEPTSQAACVALIHAALHFDCCLDSSRVLRMLAGEQKLLQVTRDPVLSSALLDAYTLTKCWAEALRLYGDICSEHQQGVVPTETPSREPQAHSTLSQYLMHPLVLRSAVRIAYVAPPQIQKAHLTAMWEMFQYPFALLCLDVCERGDTRELIEELKRMGRLGTRATNPSPQYRSWSGVAATQLTLAAYRRELIGMAFATQDKFAVLEAVVQACEVDTITWKDVESIGLQRLLASLTPSRACETMTEVVAGGGTVHEHWLWKGMLSTSPYQLETAVKLKPYALGLSAIRTFLGCERSDTLRSLTGLVDYTRGLVLLHSFSLFPLAVLLRRVCERSLVEAEEGGLWPTTEEVSLARDWSTTLHRLLLSDRRLSATLKEYSLLLHRKALRSPQSVLWSLGCYYHLISRLAQHAVSASVTSRLLAMTVSWEGNRNAFGASRAVFLFRALRRPRDRERLLLLQAILFDPFPSLSLLRSSLFCQRCPDFIVVLVADPLLTSRSYALLERTLQTEGEERAAQLAQLAEVSDRLVSEWERQTCQTALHWLQQSGYRFSSNASKPPAVEATAYTRAQHLVDSINRRMIRDGVSLCDILMRSLLLLFYRRYGRRGRVVPAPSMFFAGSGGANLVLGAPLSFFGEGTGSKASTLVAIRIPLQTGGRIPCESSQCLQVLKAFTGTHERVNLTPQQVEAILSFVGPHSQSELGITAAVLSSFRNALQASVDAQQVLQAVRLPYFGFVLHPRISTILQAAPTMSDRRSLAMVELKLKAAWRPPRLVGIEVDGVKTFLHPSKRCVCRYSQMMCVKRSAAGSCPPAFTSEDYCPNYFFRDDLSSSEGILRLLRCPSNNLRVKRFPQCHHAAGDGGGSNAEETLSRGEAEVLARCVESSGVLPLLEELQLHGTNLSSAMETSRRLGVLDVELLYPWSLAKDASSVVWLVDGDCDPLTHCSCSHPSTALPLLDVESLHRVTPEASLEMCTELFYTATTARDVSIIVSMKKEPKGADSKMPMAEFSSDAGMLLSCSANGEDYQCQVGVVDVDAKHHKALKHYWLRDRICLESWMRRWQCPVES